MFTAKDMYEALKENESNKGEIIDKWLQGVVFPKYDLDLHRPTFICPEDINTRDAERLLHIRGFGVEIFGSYITLTIPPQGD